MTSTIFYRKLSLKYCLLLAVLFPTAFCLSPASAAPSPDLWPRWQAHVAGDTRVIDHSLWDKLGVIKHLLQYAGDGLADSLRTYGKGLRYDYDWRLNGLE